MSLFDRIFRPGVKSEEGKALHDGERFKLLTAYEPVFRTHGGALYEEALVRAAIDARARHISKLRVETYGTGRPDLQAKLRLGPNQWQTWSQFLYRASTILDVYNTLFIVPVKDDSMVTTGFFPVVTDRVTIREYNDALFLVYEFRNGQTGAARFDECAVLTKYQLRNDFFGESNGALRQTLDLMDLQTQAIREAAKNGATFRFIARAGNFTKDTDLAKEKKRFTEANMSGEGGVLLFPSTYTDIKQVNSTNFIVDDKQMEMIQQNVFNYFGTNLDVLQNKAYGDAWAAFYEGAVETFAVQFSEALTRAAFSQRERALGSGVIATANRLQYLSNSDKLQVSAQMADRGIMTINEIREIWNLAPVEGGDRATIRGEYYFVDDKGETETEPQEGETEDEAQGV